VKLGDRCYDDDGDDGIPCVEDLNERCVDVCVEKKKDVQWRRRKILVFTLIKERQKKENQCNVDRSADSSERYREIQTNNSDDTLMIENKTENV
jgi:hypothetical protein